MGRFLNGWQRKLSLLPLFFFLLGWLIYSTGFIWMLVEWDQNSLNSTFTTMPISRSDPLNYPFYVILVGGPFVFLLGLLHAILPSIASSVIGFVSALVSSIFFTSAGWAVYCGALYLKFILNSNNSDISVNTKPVLIFCGSLFSFICWCFVMMLSISYNYRKIPNTHGLHNYNEIFNEDRETSSSRIRNIPFTPCFGRILSIPLVIVSTVGWCIYIVGVYRLSYLIPFNIHIRLNFKSTFNLSFYGSIALGPFLFLAALLHAGCLRGASTVMGVFTSILHMVYVILMGYNVTEIGRSIYFLCEDVSRISCSISNDSETLESIDVNLIYIFAGGAGSLLFWNFVVALWPLYRKHPSSRRDDSDGGNLSSVNVVNPISYGTMQMKESSSHYSYSAQHPRQSLIITKSNEHK